MAYVNSTVEKTSKNSSTVKISDCFAMESLPAQMKWLYPDIKNSISIMYAHCDEKPDKTKITAFIKKVTTCCDTVLGIKDAQDVAIVIRAIAEIQRDLGAPSDTTVGEFFTRTKQFCELKLNTTEPSQIAEYIGSNINRAPAGALDALYIRHLSLDPRQEIEAIKEHCRSIVRNKDARNYGDPNSFNIEAIDDYLASSSFPHSFRASFKEETISSWEKLMLTTKRFSINFLDEADKARGNNMRLYDKVIENIAGYLDMLPEQIITPGIAKSLQAKAKRKSADPKQPVNQNHHIALNSGDSYQKSEQILVPKNIHSTVCIPNKKLQKKHIVVAKEIWDTKQQNDFLRTLEQELAVRINWFVRYSEGHSVAAITSLARLTKPEALRSFFLSILTSTKEDVLSYLTSKYRSSISSMHTSRCKIPNMENNEETLVYLEDYALKNLQVNPKDLISSVMGGMQNGLGNPDIKKLDEFLVTIKDYCETKLNIKDPKLILRVISSITGMQHSKGIPDVDALISFLEQIRTYCEEKLHTKDPIQILTVLSSITGMQHKRGIPEKSVLSHFLNTITEYCNTKLHVKNSKRIIKLLRSITSMQHSQGIPKTCNPEDDVLINFLDTITDFCKTKLNVTNSTLIIRFISSITGMYNGHGIPSISELKSFLNTLNDYCEKELRTKNSLLKMALIRSITGMQNCQGKPNIDDLYEFLNTIKEHCETKLHTNSPARIIRFVSSITGMYNSRGIPPIEELKIFLNRFNSYYENKLKVPSQAGRVMMSIASMQSGQGFPDFDKLEIFLDTIINCCETKLNVKSPTQIIKIIRSITAMQARRGIPEAQTLEDYFDAIKTFCEEDLNMGMKALGLTRFVARMYKGCGVPDHVKLLKFLRKTKELCEKKLSIKDPLEITGVLHYITLIQTSREAPSSGTLESFFNALRKCQNEMFKVGQELQIKKLLHFIFSKNQREGIPKSYENLTKLLQSSNKSLADFVLSKDIHEYMTINQLQSIYLEDENSIENIKKYNSLILKTSERCSTTIERHLSLLYNIYGLEPKNTTTGRLIQTITKIIKDDPSNVISCDLINQETQDEIMYAAILYRACRDTLIKINDGLVYLCVKKYHLPSSSKSLEEDLVQAGRFGLMAAIDDFNPEVGAELSTYVFYRIRVEIKRCALKSMHHIACSYTAQEKVLKLREIISQHDSTMTVEEIAKELNTSERAVRGYMRISNGIVHLSQTSRLEGKEDSIGSDYIPDSTPDPSELVSNNELQDKRSQLVETLLSGLNSRYRDIIVKHYGLNNSIRMSLEEIGKEYSITRERVRQIKARALKIIKGKIAVRPELQKLVVKLFFDDENTPLEGLV